MPAKVIGEQALTSKFTGMKARILFWLKVGVSIALLGYLLSLIDLDRLLEKLQEVDVRYLAIASSCYSFRPASARSSGR